MIGCGDDHRVDIALVEQFPVVQVAFHLVAVRNAGLAFFVDVARGHELAGVVLLAEGVEGRGIISAAPAAADHADIDTVVGTDYTARCLAAALGSHCGSGGDSGRSHGLQKISAIKRVLHFNSFFRLADVALTRWFYRYHY